MTDDPQPNASSADPELHLLQAQGSVPLTDTVVNHTFKTAPVFTGDAYEHGPGSYGAIRSPKLYVNTNTPFSALICGVQGSGKSHTTSVLLESALIQDSRIGMLPAPLSAIVFHYDTAAGGGLVQPCEAAYLSALNPLYQASMTPPPVTVLVVPSYLRAMRKVYSGLPRVKVEPLLFSSQDVSGERLLAMMKVDETTQMPLYMEALMSMLRTMEDEFDYNEFRRQLAKQKFNGGQKAMLNLRLTLLDSCMKGGNASNRASAHFGAGQLTIIDLSSPFMDSASACGFFDMILGLFIEADIPSGKLIVLDEAHKYLSESEAGSSARFTDSLLTVIRQQRHLGTRVIVSTQEPTVVPAKYLDLCSFVIAHRFTSPKWLQMLAHHVSAAGVSTNELFQKILALQTGEAIIFAPSALVVLDSPPATSIMRATKMEPESYSTLGTYSPGSSSSTNAPLSITSVSPLGQGFLFVRSRTRVTLDGGHSLLAIRDPSTSTRLGPVSTRPEPAAILRHEPATEAELEASLMEEIFGSPGPYAMTSNPSASADVPGPSDSATAAAQSSSLAPCLIDMGGTNARFAPLIRYMQRATVHGFVNIKTVRRYFSKTDPGAFGSDPHAIDFVIKDALAAELIENFSEQSVRLVRKATYFFE